VVITFRRYVVKVGFSLRTHYETLLRKCLIFLNSVITFELLDVAPVDCY